MAVFLAEIVGFSLLSGFLPLNRSFRAVDEYLPGFGKGLEEIFHVL